MNNPADETRAVGRTGGSQPPSAPPAVAPPGGTTPPPVGLPPQPSEPGRSKTGVMALGASLAVLLVAIAALAWTVMGDDDDATATDQSASTEQTATTDQSATTEAPATTTTPGQDDGGASATELSNRVVQILAQRNGQTVCTGSGTIVDDVGTVLTNYHVIAQVAPCDHDTLGIAVTQDPASPPQLLYEADILAVDQGLDLAVIRIARAVDGSPLPTFTPVPIGDSSQIALGDSLRVIGYPGIGGDTVTITEGLVSGFVNTPEGGDRSWIKTDATIAGGNSGGLAANDAGEIVGVPTIVGTGDGPIVDCRMLVDSNGDGQTDQNDACVPTGGFINGIRPISLAQPLLAQAATATPQPVTPPANPPVAAPTPDQPVASAPVWGLNVDDQGNPVDPIFAAPSGTTNMCLTWTYANVPPGSAFEIVWAVNGVTGDGDVSAGVTSPPDAGNFFGCYGNPDGLPDGLYEAEWRVEGVAIFREAIYLGGDRQPAPVVVDNQSIEPICVVSFAPTDAVSWGLNELAFPVEPGQRIELTTVTGLHDFRVIDCLGNTVILETGVDVTPAGITLEIFNA